MTIMRSDVSTSSRSKITPSEKVLPEPDWPQRNVCRSNPFASRLVRTEGPPNGDQPMSSEAVAPRLRSRNCSTVAGSAMVMSA